MGLPYTESQPICGNLRAAGRGLLEAEYARWSAGLRGVFHDGNVGRRALHGKLDQIGFVFAIATIQPFAAVDEVAGYC